MIPKQHIMTISRNLNLQITTVQKDYVIGWLLRAISQNKDFSQWIFKGGTCLKKCYFETYRFSEDLDFTVMESQTLSTEIIRKSIEDSIGWIESNSGLTFPRGLWKIEEYENKRGNISYQVKIPFQGPMGFNMKSLQRVKFDITQDEMVVSDPVLRNIHHAYEDSLEPPPQIRCYSINEVLAEKTRALVERFGRARDVYDVVNISRNFRGEIDAGQVRNIAIKKFDYKGLHEPTVDMVLASVDLENLKSNWEHQLAHQISNLPPVESYIDELDEAIRWWLLPDSYVAPLESMPNASGEIAPRVLFPEINWRQGPSFMDQIRSAARNRQCILISYHGSERLVEPYSLRYPATGNETLHVWEREKNGFPEGKHKSYKVNEIDSISLMGITFQPKWIVEL